LALVAVRVNFRQREVPTMAKPLGPKSILIRKAITENPGKGNTELAEMLNDAEERMDDKIKVTAQDVAAQRQAMKKPGAQKAPAAATPAGNGRRKPGRKPGRKPAAAAPRPASAPTAANPVDLIDRTLALAQDCGGVEQLKRLVERLAGMQRQ
jgi:hypothetical protein